MTLVTRVRFVLNTYRGVGIGIVAILIILLLLLFLYSQMPYRASAYTQFYADNTVGLVVTQPILVQPYIRSLAPTATRWIKQIPRFSSLQPGPIRLDWFHNLPREISIAFHYLPNTGFNVQFIVKEQRNSTIFVDELNRSKFLKELCFADWRSYTLSPLAKNKDIWASEGFLARAETDSSSRILTPPEKEPLSNTHLLEILWVNTQGNLIHFFDALPRCIPSLRRSMELELWKSWFNQLYWLHCYVDLVQNNLLEGRLRIKLVPGYDEHTISEGIHSLASWLEAQLPTPTVLTVEEESANSNLRQWKILCYDFETPLKRSLGNYSD